MCLSGSPFLHWGKQSHSEPHSLSTKFTHQFLLCESCICSSLFWSVGNSSVLHECQKGRGARLGMRIVPSQAPHPTLFSCCSLPVDEVSVTCLSGLGPSGEHCRYCKPSTFFTAWPFTIISYSSFP